MDSPQFFDQYFEELINVGIAIYSNDISVMTKKKRLEYLKTLRKISNPKAWRSNNIFRGKILQHIEELSGFWPTKESVKRFINYKVLQIARSENQEEINLPSCLGNFYNNKIIESGIDMNTLEWKIQTFKKQHKNNTTNTPWNLSTTSEEQMCDNDKCCLCGNREKVTEVPNNLNDLAVRHLEYYSRYDYFKHFKIQF
jgi:hypothetical protein